MNPNKIYFALLIAFAIGIGAGIAIGKYLAE